MRGFMKEDMKRHFYPIRRGVCKCHKCRGKKRGQYLIYEDRSSQAIDGTKAWRIFHVCDEASHLNFVGYNKPVDFSLSLPKMEYGDQSYEEENEEMESEWTEMIDNAQKRKRTFYGR